MRKKLVAGFLCISLSVSMLMTSETADAAPRAQEQTSIVVESDSIYSSDRNNIVTSIGNYYILSYDSANEAEKVLNRYKKKKGASAEYSETAKLTADHLSWGPSSIGSDVLLEKVNVKNSLPTVTVAVIDSGVDYTHPMLKNRVIRHKYDFIDNDNDSMDEFGHGTHVAGIIADTTSSNVKIASYRVADKYGNASIIGLIEAIKQAMTDKVDIINLSMGSRMSSKSVNAKMLAAVLSQANKKGIVVVAAAGNEGTTAKTVWPACYSSVVAVSALKESNGTVSIADYSNYGDIVDFCAPGSEINSAYLRGEYKTLSGTSMATPFVTSAFALLKSYNYNLSSGEMEKILKDNAIDLGDPGYDKYYGYGEINLSTFTDLSEGTENSSRNEAPAVPEIKADSTDEKKSDSKVMYSINYELNGGSASPYAPETYISGQATFISPVCSPTKDGSTFIGWYFDPAFKRPATYISQSQRGNITLYAKWSDQIVTTKEDQTVVFKNRNLNISESVLRVKNSSAKLKATAQTDTTYVLVSTDSSFSIDGDKLIIGKGVEKGIYRITIRAIALENDHYKETTSEAIYTISVN